jgi:hypothetical protein
VETPVYPDIGAVGNPGESMADQTGMGFGKLFACLDFILAGCGAADDTASGNPEHAVNSGNPQCNHIRFVDTAEVSAHRNLSFVVRVIIVDEFPGLSVTGMSHEPYARFAFPRIVVYNG